MNTSTREFLERIVKGQSGELKGEFILHIQKEAKELLSQPIADKEPKDDFEKFAEQSEKDNIKWHERFESITGNGLGKSLFPLPSEWIEEFKTDWYKDNEILGNAVLKMKWQDYVRVFSMIYQYQRLAYEKNLSESQPKKDISDKELPDIDELIKRFLPKHFELSSFDSKGILLLEAAFQQGAQVMFHTLKNREEVVDKGEEAIAFAEFIAGKWKYYEGSYYSIADDFKFFKDVKYYTPAELYQLFKSQK